MNKATEILLEVVFAMVIAAIIIFFIWNSSPELVKSSSQIAMNLPDKIITSVGLG